MTRISAKFTTILPLADNNGKDNSSLVEQIEADICTITGGLTIQEVTGIWYEDGIKYVDKSHKVETAVIGTTFREVAGKLDNMKALATSWGRLLDQLAIYTEIQWSDIEILDCELDYDTELEVAS